MTIKDNEFADIATPTGPMRTCVFRPTEPGRYPGILLYSEIFQITGPIRRVAALLASHGYVVATPEIYHELEPAGTVLAYDQAGADRGNADKVAKEISAYDSVARAFLYFLAVHPALTERLGVMGISMGGPFAFAGARTPDVFAA